MRDDFRDLRVTVMGLGRFGGGVGVARWLVGRGARVLVTDRESADALAASVEQLAGLGVEFRLGGHDAHDFTGTDLLIVNPAVPPGSPFLHAAVEAGVPLSTEINLFVERCPATTVGVTGSVGKSTTTAMIGHVLARTRTVGRTWVGGNLGTSLLDRLPEITPDDVVVLELSSFQLERTPWVRWSPHVAVLTNLSPNHLDWHGSQEAYVAAKANITRFQHPQRDTLVLNRRRDALEGLDAALRGVSLPRSVWRFGLLEAPGGGLDPAAWCEPGDRDAPQDEPLRWPNVALAVPGRHNRENAAAALTVAHRLGIPPAAAAAALADFHGLPHRLQRVAVLRDVTYYNDSKSTTPEAAITAITAIDDPLLVILGGYDKKSDLTPVARLAARKARFAACVGATGPSLAAAIAAAGGNAERFERFEDAVRACQKRARPGDVVLLSPACASWDMFEDYRQRGDVFATLVREPIA